MKNYRHLGDTADVLGNRLDAARAALARSTTSWARNYWNQAVERLLFQWHLLPVLHDADAVMSLIPVAADEVCPFRAVRPTATPTAFTPKANSLAPA